MTNSYKPAHKGGSFNRNRRRNNKSSKRGSFGGNSSFGNGSGGNRRFKGGGRPSRGRFQSKVISQDKFINRNPKVHTESEYSPENTFADFGFDKEIMTILERRGYITPTRIQDKAIPHIMQGKDLVGLANTGSGKTGAFVLPIIQKLRTQKSRETILVITPTRELAQQVRDEFRQFSEGMNIYSVLAVGGLNIRAQIKELRRGCDVVIGTPGRLKDLMNRNVLDLSKTTTLVLDEADRMLDMGFLPDIKFISEKLPKERQSLCFSATTSPAVTKFTKEMVSEPIVVSVRTSETGEHIAQDIVKAGSKEEKMKELINMLGQDHFEKVLVFTQMKHSAQKLANDLVKHGFPAKAIHGNKSQPQRQKALDAFKKNSVNILVATDVAARGLDIPNVSHVINFDQPSAYDDYIHRIGRTGRAGRPGQAYTFVN